MEKFGVVIDLNRKPFYVWNTIMLIDTVAVWLSFLKYTNAWEYGEVEQYVALVVGTFLSLTFILSLCKGGAWDSAILKINTLYWFLVFLGLMADITLFFVKRDVFCTPHLDDSDSCDYIYKQLYISWGVIFVFLLIWRRVNKKMALILGVKDIVSGMRDDYFRKEA